jgi:hypothetical protein
MDWCVVHGKEIIMNLSLPAKVIGLLAYVFACAALVLAFAPAPWAFN